MVNTSLQRTARGRVGTVLVALAFVTIKIVGGALLLAVLGAPRWALAAWVMLHFRLRFDQSSRPSGGDGAL